jgi:hypothetical protein
MTNKPQTSREYFNLLSLVHLALVFGVVVFITLVYFLFFNEEPDNSNQIMLIFVALVSVVGFFGGRQMFRARVQAASAEPQLQNKLQAYRSALIAQWFLLELPALLGGIGFTMTSNLVFLAFSLLFLILLGLAYPSRERLLSHLELTPLQAAKVKDPNAIVT